MTIWKFLLIIQRFTSIQAPKGAKIIHVGLDPTGAPCVWAEVDPIHHIHELKLCVVGTGQEKPEDAKDHVGSFVQGPFVCVQGSPGCGWPLPSPQSIAPHAKRPSLSRQAPFTRPVSPTPAPAAENPHPWRARPPPPISGTSPATHPPAGFP